MSLDRQKLFDITISGLRRQYYDDELKYQLFYYLWWQIIFDDPTIGVRIKGNRENWEKLPYSKSMFNAGPGRGIVIGNLTSQLLSNIYLNELDRFVKFDLGVKYYGRYVDDFYIVSQDKVMLKDVTRRIETYLGELGLVLHPRKRVLVEINQGVVFLGAIVYPYRIHPNSRIKQGIYATDSALCQSLFDDTITSAQLVKLIIA